jgi:hypothetical protein
MTHMAILHYILVFLSTYYCLLTILLIPIREQFDWIATIDFESVWDLRQAGFTAEDIVGCLKESVQLGPWAEPNGAFNQLRLHGDHMLQHFHQPNCVHLGLTPQALLVNSEYSDDMSDIPQTHGDCDITEKAQYCGDLEVWNKESHLSNRILN